MQSGGHNRPIMRGRKLSPSRPYVSPIASSQLEPRMLNQRPAGYELHRCLLAVAEGCEAVPEYANFYFLTPACIESDGARDREAIAKRSIAGVPLSATCDRCARLQAAVVSRAVCRKCLHKCGWSVKPHRRAESLEGPVYSAIGFLRQTGGRRQPLIRLQVPRPHAVEEISARARRPPIAR
jgi:hypothetical protein